MNEGNIKRLKRLYSKLGYVTAFVEWRCWHTPYELIEKFVPKEGLIADLGCGYGLLANLLALTSNKRKIIGIDLSQRKLKYANRGLANVSFQRCDVMNFNLVGCQGIVLVHLLHHLPSFGQQERLLRICYEGLSRGGILLNLEIDKRPLWKFIFTKIVDNVAYPGNRFYFRSSLEFTDLLKSIKFRNIKVIPAHRFVPLSHVLYVAQR
jgi:SAM-dependent methyltransferase